MAIKPRRTAPYTKHLSLINKIHDRLDGKYQAEFEAWNNKVKLKAAVMMLRRVEYVATVYRWEEPVKISTFYYPCKVYKKKHTTRKYITVKNNNDFNSDKCIIIEGTVGQGKSILLRYLHSTELHSAQTIPLFIELKEVSKFESICHYAIDYINNNLKLRCSEQLFFELLSKGCFSFFLDGFDEIEYENRKEYVQFIYDIQCETSNTKVYVTSRPENEIQRSTGFEVFSIKPLTGDEQEGFIRSLLRKESEKQNRDFLHQNLIKMSLDIRELLQTPLILTLFSMVYKTKNKIPENYTEFYRKLFDTLVSEHDGLKLGFTRPTKSRFTAEKIKTVLEYLSLFSLKEGNITYDKEQLIKLIKKCLKTINEPTSNAESVLEDLYKNTCLIQKDDHKYKFLHETIPNYFTASCITNHCDDEEKNGFYSSVVKTKEKMMEWKYVLKFLEDIDKRSFNNNIYLPEIERLFIRKSLPDRFQFSDQGAMEILSNGIFAQIKSNTTKHISPVIFFNITNSYSCEKHFVDSFESNGKVNLQPISKLLSTKIKEINRPDLSRWLSLNAEKKDLHNQHIALVADLTDLLIFFDLLPFFIRELNRLPLDSLKSIYSAKKLFNEKKIENKNQGVFQV